MRRLFSGLFFAFIMLLASCAIQVAPEGGVKDVDPPKLLSATPPNYSTGFTGTKITLVFDEYIALNEIGNQLIVSPLLKSPPAIRVRKKSLLIEITDTLLPNTTYTMNFGQGIMDNNEGNKFENFQYVFSTGNIIDSLSISGKITEAFNSKTGKGMLAALYTKNYDSLPYLERPVYFSRTNDSGQFVISNVSPGFYKFIALKESNGDYLYLRGEELIGFSDTLVSAGDSGVQVKVFRELPSIKLLRSYSEFPGKAVFVFNAPADSVTWKWLDSPAAIDLHQITYSKGRDTVSIWYKNLSLDSLNLAFDHVSLNDTVTLRLFKRSADKSGKAKFELTAAASASQLIMQHVHLPFYLSLNHPADSLYPGKIILLEDSIAVSPTIAFADSAKLILKIEYAWKDRNTYSVFIPPGSIKDIYGLGNDSLEFIFSSRSETDYGSVNLQFRNPGNHPYILQLTDDSETIYRDVSTSTDSVFLFEFLDPRLYKIKLISDDNNNGIWDTGDYLRSIQPERVYYYPEKITVRSNWDVDVIVNAPERKSSEN